MYNTTILPMLLYLATLGKQLLTITNRAWEYTKLFSDVIKALDAVEEGVRSDLPAFRSYSIARKQFFADYAYVLLPYRTKTFAGSTVGIPVRKI
jgi:hypothetical protein